MTKAEYAEYLKTPHWRELRGRKIKEVGPKCQDCGSGARIQVHHLNYRNIFDVLLSDLKVVCRKCHLDIHGITDAESTPPAPLSTPKQPGVVWLRIFTSTGARLPAKFENKICIEAPGGYSHLLGLNLANAKNRVRSTGFGFEVGPTPYPKGKKSKAPRAKSMFLDARNRARQKHGFNRRKKKRRVKVGLFKPFYPSLPRRPMNWYNRGNSSN